MSLPHTLQLALEKHRAGDHPAARKLYEQVLAVDPDSAQAHNNLATLLQSQGEPAEAVGHFERAAAIDPGRLEYRYNLAGAMNNLGYAHRQRGQLDAAIACYSRAAELRPDLAEAVGNLGEALSLSGRIDQAIVALRRAAELRPEIPELQCNLGEALCQARQWEEAIAALNKSLELRPDFAAAYSNLGNVYHGTGDLERSVSFYRRAVALQPETAIFHNNLAVALRDRRQFGESISACQAALRLEPKNALAHSNLGSALAALGHLDAAEAEYGRALAAAPEYLEALTNLGHIHFLRGRLDQAAEVYRQVIARAPSDALAHWSLALILLLQGDFPRGWREYEWRWQVKELRMPVLSAAPRWDGSDLSGKTILLHHEQGFGDTIQFARYAELVKQRGGRVILGCQPELHALLCGLGGVEQCVTLGQAMPAHDVACPLLSLPGIFGTTVQTIPAAACYLAPDPTKAESWRKRMGADGRKKIGLAWAGRPNHPNDRNRSLPFSVLAPLLQIEQAQFFSLQKGDAARQAVGMPVTDWTDELRDFSDTAALVANLDLVITIDSAVAHLAGAMGKPVWVLLPFVPDWRWLMDRVDTPWYPAMRLFRQKHDGDWAGVIEAVRDADRTR